MICNYWNQLFQEEPSICTGERLLHDQFPWISSEDWDLISHPFAACEVQRALFGMKPYKAPGPSGFQPLFFQHYWDVVALSVINLVQDVLRGKEFPEGLNDAFLVLIY